MSIQTEEITLKQFTSGTTLMYFSTHLDAIQTGDEELVPSIVQLDNNNNPIDAFSFDGNSLWKRNSDNHYVVLPSITSNYVTGHSYSVKESRIFSESSIEIIRKNFSESISVSLNTGETKFTSDGPIYSKYSAIPNHKDYVFSKTHEIDDFFVNIKLNRNFGTLDTLKIYNNIVNSTPTQESETGVVFGKLVARQNILDSDGNNIEIPLRNVPIGIFNSSEDFPQPTSVNENGDRFFLNLKESSYSEEYFNADSFSSDTGDYLRTASQFDLVPDQYKHITTTNENGEFIIYNVPVGNQTVIYEVDLFKQGLTKDEIALNFFPFPASNNSVLDAFPSFSFKQFPVSVIPTWGTIQTGYTELNIVTNYDLRKWTTYFIPPMAYRGNKLGSTELFEFSPSLNVNVRDMSREGFPETNIPIVEIHKIYDKDENQTLLWEGEFAQLKKTAKFYDHGFRAFKLQANMYDPKGYRTDMNGVPRTEPTSQGVWLSGYELKLYYSDEDSIFRTTGFQRNFYSDGWNGRDHYHLNRGDTSVNTINSETEVYIAPYDKPWSHLYPEKYKIPEKPSVPNYNKINNSGRLPGSAPFYLEQPEFVDGDLVGFNASHPDVIVNSKAGGYGVQYSFDNKHWFENRFSKETTASLIYKYESGVALNEKYACGYEPSNSSFPIQPSISNVVNGEKYQRIECGYGYWLRPEGWPPVVVDSFGDYIFQPSTTTNIGVDNYGPGTLNVGVTNGDSIVQAYNIPIDIYNVEDRDIALSLDNNSTYIEGSLDIYRIINPKDRVASSSIFIPTFAKYNFQKIFVQRGPIATSAEIKTAYDDTTDNLDDEYFSRISGSGHADALYNNYLQIKIKNNGSINVLIPGSSIELGPNDEHTFNAIDLSLNGLILELPGNSDYDFAINKYTKANYSMEFLNISPRKFDGTALDNGNSASYGLTIMETNVVAEVIAPNYWLVSRYFNVKTQYNEDSGNCYQDGVDFGETGDEWKQNVRMNGPMFPVIGNGSKTGNSSFVDITFLSEPIVSVCGYETNGEPIIKTYNNNITSIPVEIS